MSTTTTPAYPTSRIPPRPVADPPAGPGAEQVAGPGVEAAAEPEARRALGPSGTDLGTPPPAPLPATAVPPPPGPWTPPPEGAPSTPPTARPPARSRNRGLLTALFAVLSALVMLLHAWVPNGIGNLGSLVETFLPWLGLAVPVTLGAAGVRRSRRAAVAALAPALAWLLLFGGTAFGATFGERATGGDLTVVSHNVNEENRDPKGTARALAASGADLVALEELSPVATPDYEAALAGSYRYHVVEGTVGLWSRYPLSGSRTVPIMPWPRALRSTVATPQGPVAVFVAHLASVRVSGAGFTAGARDAAGRILGSEVAGTRCPGRS